MSAGTATMSSVPTAMAVRAMRKSISEHFGHNTARRLSHPAHMFTLAATPDLTDRVAVVTGGTEGVGYAAAHTMLLHNLERVHLLVPDFEAALGAMADLQTDLGDVSDRVTYHQVDFADWMSVYSTAQKILAHETRLDIVINNASIGATAQATSDLTGIDRHLSANHFGHVVLVSALLPLLKRTADLGDTVRIVNQASDAHAECPREAATFRSTDEFSADLGSPLSHYARSKLANILHARYLARHLTLGDHPNIIINTTNPGLPDTGEDVAERLPAVKKDLWDAATGGTLFAATVTERSGEYICPPGNTIKGSDMARDSDLGEQLMTLTRKVLCEKLGTEDWWDY